MLKTMTLTGLMAASFILTSCDEVEAWGNTNRFKEDFHYTYDLKPGGKVYLENKNGSVEIVGWEKNSVDISGTKYASVESVMRAMKIDVTSTPDDIRIRTVAPSDARNYGARYVMRVPQQVLLDKIESSNGSIRVETISGNARLRTSNGGVRVSNLKGSVDITTSNGGVNVNGQTGGVTVRTSNGGVTLEDVKGSLEATTSNGSITARLSDPEPQRTVRLESSNGGINLTMERWNDNDIRAHTSNSSVTVRLPANTRGSVKAHTSNGHVTTDFDVLVSAGTIGKSHVEGKIGTGGPMLDLSSSNGSIRILKL